MSSLFSLAFNFFGKKLTSDYSQAKFFVNVILQNKHMVMTKARYVKI